MVVFQKYDLRFKTKLYLFGHKSSEESESKQVLSYFSTKVQKKVKVNKFFHIFPLKASVPIYISAGQDLPDEDSRS